MTSVLIERAENGYLLIVQDNSTGKRMVLSIPFEGEAAGYAPESLSVQQLMSLAVPVEVTAAG